MNKQMHAYAYAMAAHEEVGQLRKYTGEPYIVHPVEVAEIIQTVPHTEAMICAAYLHDTVEDTNVTIEDICREFGPDVANLVSQLTDVSSHQDGNRQQRKAKDREHTAKASPEAKTIKLADLISNTKSIVAFDREFAAVYLAEKMALLEVLKEGDPTLWDRAYLLARDGIAAVYLAEKMALLEVLKEGDPTLWDRAYLLACDVIAALGH